MAEPLSINLHDEYFLERKVVTFDITVFVEGGEVKHVLEQQNPDVQKKYVQVPRDNIAKINLHLADDDVSKQYKFLTLIFEDDHRGACHKVRLGDKGFMIWDNNMRGKGFDAEIIKYSIILQNINEGELFDTPYEDPIIIND